METPPTIGDRPGLVRPAVPPGAVVAFVALLVIGALAWGVGAFWWVDDTTIHEPTVPPTGAPGHSSHEVGIEPRDLVYVVHGHTGTVPVILFREGFEAQPNRLVGYAGDGAAERFRRTVRERTGLPYIEDIATTIASMADDPDDQARIAVSRVQHLDYDDARAAGTLLWRPVSVRDALPGAGRLR